MSTKKDFPYRTGYLDPIYNINLFPKMFNDLVKKVKLLQEETDFDAIAFTGTSGAAVAYPLSLKLKKPLICVRKEGSHSLFGTEGVYNIKKYIIVDDFIDTGDTINTIRDKVFAQNPKSKLVQIFLYFSPPNYKEWDGVPITYLNYEKYDL